jgi:hypothetical protein
MFNKIWKDNIKLINMLIKYKCYHNIINFIKIYHILYNIPFRKYWPNTTIEKDNTIINVLKKYWNNSKDYQLLVFKILLRRIVRQ